MKRHAPLFAAALFCPLVCLATPAQAAGKAESCLKLNDNTARLSCYDKALGYQAPAKADPAAQAAPAAKEKTNTTPVLPSQQKTVAQFGSELMAKPAKNKAGKSERLDKITSVVKSYSFSPFKKFTVVLANGQIWRQESGDAGRPARFPHHKSVHVTIERALFGSYNLTIEGSDLIYKVKRLK